MQTLAEIDSQVGREIGVSPWFEVTQQRIDRFAAAIADEQWIHTDPQRARRESPYGATIAHGFLTLSLLSHLFESVIDVSGTRLRVNYGLNKVRFTAAVPAGARVRGRFTLARRDAIEGGAQYTWNVVVEREGADKPCCVAEWITRGYL